MIDKIGPTKSVAEKIDTRARHHEMLLPAQQEQSSDGGDDADQSLPRRRFVKNKVPAAAMIAAAISEIGAGALFAD